MPTTPYDAKGLLIASIEDNNPVIFIEHRWLHNITGEVPEGVYRVPLGRAKVVREGEDVTIVATSYMTLEALRAAEVLVKEGVEAEVIDVRTLKPIDFSLIIESVRKTSHLIMVDLGWRTVGFSAEIVARIAEEALSDLKSPPRRLTLPDCPTPTTPALANNYYPRAVHIVTTVMEMLGLSPDYTLSELRTSVPLDIPDKSFTGPF
jgi:pyruvate dehydrogenase E1 component beta subunit